MLSSVELLDMARARQDNATDYRIAKILGKPQATVSNYRTGRTKPTNSIAMRLGELAGVDPLEAAASINLERATDPEDREFWELLLQRLASPKRGKKPA